MGRFPNQKRQSKIIQDIGRFTWGNQMVFGDSFIPETIWIFRYSNKFEKK